MPKHVIIGNGIAGITVARQLRKLSKDDILVISAESDYFFSRPALMYYFMGHMPEQALKPYEDWFWEKNKIQLKKAYVQHVDVNSKMLKLDSGEMVSYDTLVLATGSHSVKGNWHGSHFSGIQSLISIQDVYALEENIKNVSEAVVAGGGLIGVELVEMLLSRNIAVTFLVREFKFWNRVLPPEESQLLEKHIRDDHGVDLRVGTEIKDIQGDAEGRISGLSTSDGQKLLCQFLGVTIGVAPNIGFLESSGIETSKGVLVNAFFETNVPDVYAIGDCAEFRNQIGDRPRIEQIWYTGKMHGEALAYTLAGKRTEYKPVNFFNSAKIFDIEYQVYSRKVVIPYECQSVFWSDDYMRKSIRVFFDPQTKRFEGITVLGIRLRHEVCDRWLREEHSLEYVVEHLSDARFDPEFYPGLEQKIVDVYNLMFDKNLKLKKRNWKRIFQLK
jgi:NAD(P)H-nitrite reductase large subunit